MLMCDQGYIYPHVQEALDCLSLTAHVKGVAFTPAGGFVFVAQEAPEAPRFLWRLEPLDVLSLEEPPRRPAPLAPLWVGGRINLDALRGSTC